MKFRAGPESCRKGKGSYFTLPILIQKRMQRRSSSLDYMPALMLPVIGEGKLAHFDPIPDIRGGGGERSFCEDLEWRDGGSVGPRSFPKTRGLSPPTGRLLSSPHRQPPPQRHSDPSPPNHFQPQMTETVITLLPSHLGSSSSDRPRRAYFQLRSDDTGERSASNQSLSDWRGPAGVAAGELPRLAARSHSSADSNAKHSSGVFVLPTDPLQVDSPRVKDQLDPRLAVSGGRGSQWSPISKDSAENVKLGLESNVGPTSSRLLQSDDQEPDTAMGRALWTTRQRLGLKPEVRPGQEVTLYTQERTFIGVSKVTPLTRMNQILCKSNTNLSKSEFVLPAAGRRGNNNTSNLQRHCSEMNLVNRLAGNDGPRGSQQNPNAAAQRPAVQGTQLNRKTLIKSQSQPLFRPGNERQRPPANRKSHAIVKNENTNTPEAEEKMKQERIIEWLLDIDGCAERPDSPFIFEDGPLQSDTAIHVVYEGD